MAADIWSPTTHVPWHSVFGPSDGCGVYRFLLLPYLQVCAREDVDATTRSKDIVTAIFANRHDRVVDVGVGGVEGWALSLLGLKGSEAQKQEREDELVFHEEFGVRGEKLGVWSEG